jgi:DNA polymerase/3'-5' exonuclease PolX
MHEANQQMIEVLKAIADIERVKGDTFRHRAYINAIRSIKDYSKEITSGKEALELEGIGKSIAAKIDELIETGQVKKLIKLEKDPLIKSRKIFQNISGFGPRKVNEIMKQKIKNIKQLKKAIKKDDISLNDHQKLGLKYYKATQERIPYKEIEKFEEKLKKLSKKLSSKNKLQITGSFRRKRPDSGDIDVLLTNSKNIPELLINFIDLLKNEGILIADISKGKNKYMGFGKTTKNGKIRRIDILVIPYEEYAPALLYFTGSKRLNLSMRELAKKKGYLLNEKGLYKNKKLVKTKKEKDIFEKLGMKYLKPKDRE